MMLHTVYETKIIHILQDISRSEGNHIMKFSQLIGDKMRNFFLKHHTENVVEKLVPDPNLKNQN